MWTSQTHDLKALNVRHYCCYSSPFIVPSPILHPSSLTSPSLCPLTVHSALSAVPPIKSPFYGVTVPFCLVALASFVLFLWLSHILILPSVNLPVSLPVVFSYLSPLSPAQASSPMDQQSHQKPRGSHGLIDTTDIPVERSRSTLMLMLCTRL